MQALLGPGTLGRQMEFSQVTSDMKVSPPLLNLNSKLPVRSDLLNSLETSHCKFTGGAVVVGAGGASSALPLAEQSVTTHTLERDT